MKKLIIASTIAALTSTTVMAKTYETLPSHLPTRDAVTGNLSLTDFQKSIDGDIIVTDETFILAEADKYFAGQQHESGLNKFHHEKSKITVETQTVVRQNRDVVYSKGLFDTKGGFTIELPEAPYEDAYMSAMVVDENHRIITGEAIYAGESLTVTPDMLSTGQHVWVVLRTDPKDESKEAYEVVYKQQADVNITTHSSEPYVAKGFDQETREEMRTQKEKQIIKADLTNAFGAPDDETITHFDASILTGVGFGGFDTPDAHYKLMVAEDRSGACQVMSFKKPSLKPAGFFSVTTYGSDGYIHADEYALNSKDMVANADGSYTVHFGCGEDAVNNIEVIEKWSGAIRLYLPADLEEIVEYADKIVSPYTPK